MKKNHYTFLMLFFAAVLLNAQQNDRFTLVNQAPNEINISYQKNKFQKQFTAINSKTYMTLIDDDATPLLEKGAPELPKLAQSIIIPNTGDLALRYTYDGYSDYSDVLIAPSKGNLKRNVNPADVPYTFGPSYEKDQFYPNSLAKLQNPYILRNYRGVAITVYPYQYNPVRKVLRVYHNLQVSVLVDTAKEGINELKTSNLSNVKPFQKIYKNHFLNAENHINSLRYIIERCFW